MEKEHKKEHHEQKTHEKKQTGFNLILPVAIACIIVGIVIGALAVSMMQKPIANNNGASLQPFVSLPKGDVGNKTVAYLNDNFFTKQGVEAKLDDVTAYGSAFYSVQISVFKGSDKQNSLDLLVTQDGNLLIQPAVLLNLNEKVPEQPAAQQETLSCNDVQKADTAKLEAFVVSNCPYGLQMQRVLAPIANAGFAANIKVRYLGEITNGKITSMHGDAEAQENLQQICIREEQSNKYWAYVSEYIKKGDSNAALETAKIDKAKLSSCLTDASKGLTYAQEDFDLANQYGASGSPYLVLNGVPVSEFAFAADQNISSDSARSADNVKNLLCCGFSSKPAVCTTALATDGAATAFSEVYSSGSSTGAASCG